MSQTLSAEHQELLDNCSLLLDWLALPAASTTSSSSIRPVLGNYQICESSRPNATFSYVIAISNDAKCYVALNSNVFVEKLMEVQSPVDILKGISSGTTIGTISGQLSTFPRYFPFSTVLNLLSKYKLTSAIITGLGWSGTLAHTLTVILRELARSVKLKMPMKCVSFSGPLCASQSLHAYLRDQHLNEHHLTVNRHRFIVDRLLLDYQQLSLLTHSSDIDSWRPIYETLFKAMINYQNLSQRGGSAGTGDDGVVVPSVDLHSLRLAEKLLERHPEYLDSGEALLQPIGTYMFVTDSASLALILSGGDAAELCLTLRGLDNLTNPSDSLLPSSAIGLDNQLTMTQPQRQPLFSKEISFKPTITSLNVVKYSQRCTLIFDGAFLDCTLGREARNEIQLEADLNSDHGIPSRSESMPFFIQSGSYEVQPNARILFVRAMANKVIIDVSGFTINSSLQIGLRTDFGDSNTVSFEPSSIIAKDDTTPISLHPVMNSSFLLGALLRVALCYRDCATIENLKTRYQFIFHLWVLLLDLERSCPLPNPLLDIQMQAYVNGQFDLIILKNVCKKRMEDISLHITTLDNDTEGALRHGARTMLGGLGRLTGGLIATAGVILTVPSMILSLPAAMYVANQNRNRTEQQPLSVGVGMGVYLSLVGLLSIPGVVVAGLGAVLSSAGIYAMKDKESINYKNILYTLLTLLGESNQDIVDEITPLENHVIELFSRYFPQCNLISHSSDEIFELIRKEASTSPNSSSSGRETHNLQAINLVKYAKKNKNIFLKLKLIFKIRHIRKLLENNLFVTFLSTNNGKKSLVLNKLFEIDMVHMRSYGCVSRSCSGEFFSTSTPAGGVSYGGDPSIHQIGNWMNEQEEKSEVFKQWMSQHERKMLQIYAIDYPSLPQTQSQLSVTDATALHSSSHSSEGPPSPSPSNDSSNYSVELSSIFIILLTEEPHQISAESIKYIDLAKSNHKPYLVLVDLSSDSSSHHHHQVITTPGQYESYKESYSRELDIPVDLIHFTNPLDPNSTDKLRGLLFGMVQNLIASPYMSQVLSLKFLPANVIESLIASFPSSGLAHAAVETVDQGSESSPDLSSSPSSHAMDILSIPDILATATSSLLYNLCSLNSNTIRDSCRQLLTENSPDILKASDRKSTLQTLPFGIHLQAQQIAFSLALSDSICLLFTQILSFRLKLFKDSLTSNQSHNIAVAMLTLLADASRSSEVDNMLSVLVLTFIRQQVNEYLGMGNQDQPSQSSDKTNIQYLCTEILLGMQMWINLWVEKGYSLEVVSQAVKVALSDAGPISNSHFLQVLNRLHTSYGLLEGGNEQFLGGDDPVGSLAPLLRRASSSHDADRQLLSGFQLTRDQYTQIMKIITFQPFQEIHLSYDQGVIDDHSLALQRYHDSIKEYNKTHSSTSKVTLTQSTGIVLELIAQLMALSSEELRRNKILFTVASESAIDVNGVTRSVLTQVAKEINENPSVILLKKDEQSNLIYFDPDACSQSDAPGLREHLQFIYTGFGRLIGLCLVKASVGATLPIDFPLTFYRLILGHRFSMSDLFTIDPQIATSLSNICLMDQETLDLSCLDFTITRSDHSVFELIPNGANHPVTIHNRVEYIRKALQYYLCSHETAAAMDSSDTNSSPSSLPSTMASPLLFFLLGIQSVCPRHHFHHFNPISLQLLLEGNRLDINVSEWRECTEYRLQGGSLFQTNLLNQTTALEELGEAVDGTGLGDMSTQLAEKETKEEQVHNPTIEMFWEVVREMDEVDKRRLLCFSVGTTSLPYDGFRGLKPKFTLVVGTLSVDSLPISHTCFHMLILPKYEAKEVMKEKILQAIRETGISDLGIV
jgi:hypothetical protein